MHVNVQVFKYTTLNLHPQLEIKVSAATLQVVYSLLKLERYRKIKEIVNAGH